jgi:hypothetical protein
MRRLFIFLPLLLILLSACAGQKDKLPVFSRTISSQTTCPTLFPQGNYQFVHLIEFSMPGGNNGTVMGVTVIHDKTIHSALMTVEGFVLFAADYTDTLSVSRAVSPFDKPGFASGMMADIRTIFFQPQGRVTTGSLPDSRTICRTVSPDSTIIDLFFDPDKCLQLKLYPPTRYLQTEVTGCAYSEQQGREKMPEVVVLQSHKLGGYRLKMTLVSAEKI